MRVLIVGAGVGGLTAALSLHAAGIEALVVEASASLRPLGVGINLLPHATRELTELGLGDAMTSTAIATAEMVHFDRHGGRIWGEPRGLALGYDWPQYSIHRGELQMILLDAVLDRLGPGSVRTASVLEGFEQDADGVRAHVLDRIAGTGAEIHADVLVGADGLHSSVRAQLHPGEPGPLWNGIRMWRGVAEGEPFLTGRTMAVAGSNAAAKLVVYPISIRRPLINWVAEIRTDDGMGPHRPADWNRGGRLEDVLPYYADWRFPWLDVPALLARTPRVLEYPMVDRDPLPFWTRGRVTLLGDAAHPMYPIGSNGGSQAVLDARVLAHELARCGDPGAGLAAYERARRETVNAIVLACRDMPADRVLQTVAERAPDGFDRIEDVLTAEELESIGSAYQRTSFSDAKALNTRPSLSVAG
ncbi:MULTISPECIES: flavin-dependent oxidoreductase [Thermomonosporaceae]|uniref:flavin-dependent oxidoreductase n=1 Tax=Thermomonosporaceae TaxID=2012 RepID=UPI00255A8418|nr:MULTISPECIES: flavin-dependent oxidoreductase [Thermomonosporaceae]MDL4774738.1 flavin-dependent oxidoreductase [Actinomadura xylanilytica]